MPEASKHLKTTIGALARAEDSLLRTLHEVSGFKSTSAALAYIYKTKSQHEVLNLEDHRAAMLSMPIPDVPRFFATVALVDVIIDLQFQRSVSLQNVTNCLQ